MFTTLERHRMPVSPTKNDGGDFRWHAVSLTGPPNWYLVYLRKPGPARSDSERCRITFLAALSDLLQFRAPDNWSIVAAQFVATNFAVPSLVDVHDIRRVLAWEEPGATDPTYLLELAGGKVLAVAYESSAVIKEHRMHVLDELPVAWFLPRLGAHQPARRNDV